MTSAGRVPYHPGMNQPRISMRSMLNRSQEDQMRARLPRQECCADRDGVKIHCAVYGDGRETMVLLPPWAFVHSRCFNVHAPYFSERCRCIT
jgi:hypothetical protein